MSHSKLRRQITWEAARLMYARQESEYYRAKIKAARWCSRSRVKPVDLPSNLEIRAEIQSLARLYEGDKRTEFLYDMRLESLRMMRILRRFRPRLIGSVLTGHVRMGSDIDLHVFANSVDAVTCVLDEEGACYDVERKHVRKDGEKRLFTHIHIRDRFPFELTIYPFDKTQHVWKSSITGKAMERASIAELEQLLVSEYPHICLDEALEMGAEKIDRFQVFESLLLPLESVKESPKFHPEGDALYHSLQVFDLGRDELPYDEEFLLAALLHDVGKAVDGRDHVTAGLSALSGFITERTEWLIANHMRAHQILDGTLGVRAKRRLRNSESYDELMLLADCDRQGRQAGIEASELDDALLYLRQISSAFGI